MSIIIDSIYCYYYGYFVCIFKGEARRRVRILHDQEIQQTGSQSPDQSEHLEWTSSGPRLIVKVKIYKKCVNDIY